LVRDFEEVSLSVSLLTLGVYSGIALIGLIGAVAWLGLSASLGTSLFLLGLGSSLLGGLFLFGGKNRPEETYRRIYVTSAEGYVQIFPELNAGSDEKRKSSSPSGLTPRTRLRTDRSWLSVSSVGVAMIIAGVGMLATVVVLGIS
jgi:hypothetical protein